MMAERKLTGKHVAMIFVGAFGVIIIGEPAAGLLGGAHLPGAGGKNSYVASQTLRRSPRGAGGAGLGRGRASRDGILRLSINDAGRAPCAWPSSRPRWAAPPMSSTTWSPSSASTGRATSPRCRLPDGNWNIRMSAIAGDGTPFEQRVVLIKD
jgi:nitrogen fixation protein FixH